MDPFLELQEWDDFHYSLNAAIRDALSPRLAPRYVVHRTANLRGGSR